jgi:poly(A) polymerase
VQIPDVPPQLLAALVEAAAGQRLALVGGVVRDLLLHRHHHDPWRGLPDLDLVVEGRAADLVEHLPAALERQFGMAIPLRQQPHGRYGTVELELQLPQELGGTWLVDLASARREVYPQPAHNPVVSPGTLEQDLARRDVTVNAMALELDPGGSGEVQLLDPHGGQADLAQRQLRFLHADSLRDDPTRVVRAARYAARLGFDLVPDSLDQIINTVKTWPWAWRPGDSPQAAPPALATRLRMELELLVQREPWPTALLLLQTWGGLAILDAGLQAHETWRRRSHWSSRLQVPSLLAVIAGADEPLVLGRRLQLPQRWLVQLERALRLKLQLQALSEQGDLMTWRPSQWCLFVEAPGFGPHVVALALLMGAVPRRPLLDWWWRWRHIKAPESAADLLIQGWQPGPDLGAELKRKRLQALDALTI